MNKKIFHYSRNGGNAISIIIAHITYLGSLDKTQSDFDVRLSCGTTINLAYTNPETAMEARDEFIRAIEEDH